MNLAKEILLQFLEKKRNRSLIPPVLKCTDTSLFKLYVEFEKFDKVEEFLTISNFISFEIAEIALKEKNVLHLLAKLYKSKDMITEALNCMKSYVFFPFNLFFFAFICL